MMKLATGMKHLRFVRQIWLNCKRRGARVLLDNPLTYKAWKLTPWLGSSLVAARRTSAPWVAT
eukprot:651846-Pyramimonas_sp.AAC.1